ncbi:MAG: (d)CMP kinase [Clostridia bacterium]|nr:(d)CMP kinase [Clostridia bacterium]
MNKPINIAIDGPSGSGKSTLASMIAAHYGFIYIDTGAMYRTVGLYIQRKGFASDDKEAIVSVLSEINIDMVLMNGKGVVTLDGVPVGDEIRTPKSSMYASDVSKIPEVRAFLLDLQRDIAKRRSTVMDGRDIGTVILPDAQVKLFLIADDTVRAHRRYMELLEKGEKVTEEEVLSDMRRRDKNDSGREVCPAVAAKDAILLDNSGLSAEATFEKAKEIIDGVLAK